MINIFAKLTWLEEGWAENVRLSVAGGLISAIHKDQRPEPGDVTVDCLLPALANLHSHSFQRAMAGMAEVASIGKDSFWTWRQVMYRFLDHLTPDQIEAIAALVFMEMQEAGYASVGEFHYLHHQPGGASYASLSETSLRVFAAASQSGIGLTHLPVLYSYGGAEQTALGPHQLRFGND